jgi:hypothetical protein
MALQPFVGPWPLLQFRNHFYTDGTTPWTGDQPVAKPLPTHRTAQTQNKRTEASVHWVGVLASQDSSCLRSRGNSNLHLKQYLSLNDHRTLLVNEHRSSARFWKSLSGYTVRRRTQIALPRLYTYREPQNGPLQSGKIFRNISEPSLLSRG